MTNRKNLRQGDLFQRAVVHSLSLTFLVLFLYSSLLPVGSWTTGLILSFIGALGAYEYRSMLNKKIHLKPNYSIAIGTFGFLLCSFITVRWASLLPSFLGSLHWLFLVCWVLWLMFSVSVPHNSPLQTIGSALFSILYVGVPLHLFLRILYGFVNSPQPHLGVWWASFLIATTKGADIFGYFFGKAFGKKAIAPVLSPNKTMVGFLSGCIGSILIASLFCFEIPSQLSPYISHPGFLLPFGLFLGICGFLGDLLESNFKRDADIKDSASFYAVGGILDNLDSLLLSTPVLYFLLSVTQAEVFHG